MRCIRLLYHSRRIWGYDIGLDVKVAGVVKGDSLLAGDFADRGEGGLQLEEAKVFEVDAPVVASLQSSCCFCHFINKVVLGAEAHRAERTL